MLVRTAMMFCLLLASSIRATIDPKLTERLDKTLSKFADTGTIYVARVVDAESGRELYLHDPDRAVMPASNMKLTTTAAGLDRFGPDYQWRTYLAMDADDLWIIGTGDPTLGDRRTEESRREKRMAFLDDWANALAAHGTTHVKGKLYYDDGDFDDEFVGPTWTKSELTDWWSAPVSGLSINQNCVDVTAYLDRLEVLPLADGIKVVNLTRSTGKAEPLAISREANSNTFTLKGLVKKKEAAESTALINPGLILADALRTKLKSHGITVDGPIERATRAAAKEKWGALKATDKRDARVIAVRETSMTQVLKRTNKQSQNMFAESICKLQGRAWSREHGHDEPGGWKAGGEAVRDFLQRMKIDESKYVIVDGSGLSFDDRVTARLISDLLLKMRTHKYADTFRESLSICGKDGTLDDRMTDIAGHVLGKSGTIDGVKALSGYLTTRAGKTLVFSLIYNNAPPAVERRCAAVLDDACRAMVEWNGK